MNDPEFKTAALMELANHDMLALAKAMRGSDGLMAEGIAEVGRLNKAQEAFPSMSLGEMWATDRTLKGQKQGRPSASDLQKIMTDPAWAAVSDLERLKKLWRDMRPSRQVPVEFLTDIVVQYRDVERAAVVARRSRPKSRLINDN